MGFTYISILSFRFALALVHTVAGEHCRTGRIVSKLVVLRIAFQCVIVGEYAGPVCLQHLAVGCSDSPKLYHLVAHAHLPLLHVKNAFPAFIDEEQNAELYRSE